MSATYTLVNIPESSFVRSAHISRLSERYYILVVTPTFSNNASDYIGKTLTAAKIIFAKSYYKGAKWEYSKDPD